MTNLKLLEDVINQSGYKKSYIAASLGLTRQGLFKKLRGSAEFKADEMAAIKKLLHLTDKEVMRIFFSNKVD